MGERSVSSSGDKSKDGVDKKLMTNGDTSPTVKVSVPTKVSPPKILLKTLPYALALFLTFGVTLACFPAITALVVSTDSGPAGSGSKWANVYFIPVACFLLFNLGDYFGR